MHPTPLDADLDHRTGAPRSAPTADRSVTVLRVLLGLGIAVSIVHYIDNTVRYDDYVQGASTPVARWMVPAGWILFTAAGIAGLLLYERGRYGPAAGLLAFYSVSGLIGFAHYQSISPTDFDGLQNTFIVLDIACGASILGFAIWAAVRR